MKLACFEASVHCTMQKVIVWDTETKKKVYDLSIPWRVEDIIKNRNELRDLFGDVYRLDPRDGFILVNP